MHDAGARTIKRQTFSCLYDFRRGRWDSWHNPGSHSDHMTTGKAARALQEALPCLNAALFADYATTEQVNLPVEMTIVKAALFAVNNAAKASHGWPGDWDPGHLSFMRALVYRFNPGNGKNCEF